MALMSAWEKVHGKLLFWTHGGPVWRQKGRRKPRCDTACVTLDTAALSVVHFRKSQIMIALSAVLLCHRLESNEGGNSNIGNFLSPCLSLLNSPEF